MMIDTIQTSSDSGAFGSTQAPAIDAKNADERPCGETAESGTPQTKTEPKDASAQAESQKPREPGSSEPRPTGPERADGSSNDGASSSRSEPEGFGKLKGNFRHVVGSLLTSPLAAGESLDDYGALLEEIHKAVEPQDLFDYLRLSDIGHALWEERRYRQQLAALPNAARFKALMALLLQVSPNFQIKASQFALDYFGPDAEAYERTKRFLLRYDITDEAITAQAHEMHGQTMGALERMISQRQNVRNRVINEVKRDQRKAEKKKAKPKGEDSGPASGTTH